MAMENEYREYLPGIDGLRAIAIISVLLFHMEIGWFSGGYVGVDVFFVISGYLITRNIVNDIWNESFYFVNFYYRRARRLLPAYLFTVLIASICGYFLLTPKHFARLGGSVIFSAFSLSNVFFWKESGYFDTSAAFKPLLHFWSLSVEEQFYLVWPALLVLFCLKRNQKKLFFWILIIFASSLFFAEYLLKNYSDSVFFLTPFRMYEFCVGGVCLLISKIKIKNWHKELLLSVGLLMIFLPVSLYDKEVKFPGMMAMLPCLGAGFVLLSTDSKLVGKILRNNILVYIGLISYSLYLIHWPILVYYKYWKFEPLSNLEKVLLFVISIFVASLMRQYIEEPLRIRSGRRSNVSPKIFIYACLILILIMITPAVSAWVSGGWLWRVDTAKSSSLSKGDILIRRNEQVYGSEHRYTIGVEKSGPAEVLILGDSHAGHLAKGFDYLGRKYNLKIDVWTHLGCPPVWGTYKIYGSGNPLRQQSCKDVVPRWEEIAVSGQYQIVVLASRWMWLYEPTGYGKVSVRRDYLVDRDNPIKTTNSSRNVFKSKIQYTINKIHQSGSRVIVFSQVPLLGKDIQDCLNVPRYFVDDSQVGARCQGGVSYDDVVKRLEFTDTTIRNLSSRDTMVVIPSDYFCDRANRTYETTENGHVLYEDDEHLSDKGSLFLTKKIEKDFIIFVNKAN